MARHRTSQFSSIRSDAGMSLLSVVIAAGCMSIVIVAMSKAMAMQVRSQKSVELRGDREAFRRRIVSNIDCAQTLTHVLKDGSCNGPIDLLGKRGRYLVRRDSAAENEFVGSGPVGNGWYAKATCAETSLEIRVAKRVASTWDVAKDPATGNSMGFEAAPNPIFGETKNAFKLCEAYFDAPESEAPNAFGCFPRKAGTVYTENTPGYVYAMLSSGGGIGRRIAALKINGVTAAQAVAQELPTVAWAAVPGGPKTSTSDQVESKYFEVDRGSFSTFVPVKASWQVDVTSHSLPGWDANNEYELTLCFLPQ